jgi:hypothetical protein
MHNISDFLLDKLNRPLIGYWLCFRGNKTYHYSDGPTGLDGKFQVKGLEPGTYRISYSSHKTGPWIQAEDIHGMLDEMVVPGKEKDTIDILDLDMAREVKRWREYFD